MTIGSQGKERTSGLSSPASATEDGLIAGGDLPPRTKYGSLLRAFLLRFCVAVTLGLILLLVGEIGAYLRGIENQHSMEPDLQAAAVQGNADEREYWKEQEPAQKVQYEPYVLWRRAPFNGRAILIDAAGIRRTLHTHCDASTFTAWMFGDSVMWGWGSPDSETIPSLLAQDYERAGRQVCIVNYGEKGWANTQELIALVEQLKHTDHKPDVVLFYDGGTEAFTAYENKQVDVHSNYLEFKNYFEGLTAEKKSGFSYLRRTNTYRFLENIATKVSPKESGENDTFSESKVQTLSRGIMQNYLQNMDIIGLLAKQYGFRPVFVWYPNMAVGHKQLTAEEEELNRRLQRKFPRMDLVYRAAYDRCREVSRPDLYDLGDLLDDSRITLYRGIAHLNAAGNQIAADRLFQILEHPPNPVIARNTGRVAKTPDVHLSGSKANRPKP
jgi:hypothetical protein